MSAQPGESTYNPGEIHAPGPGPAAAPAGSHAHHILPVRVYLLVWLALMLLLGLTLLAGHYDLDRAFGIHGLNLNMIVALLIAGTKAALVLLFFMHVKYASKLTWIFIGAGLLWLATLIGLTMTDYLSRGWRH